MLASFAIALRNLRMALRQSATANVQFKTIAHITLLCVVAGLRMNDLASSFSFLFDVTFRRALSPLSLLSSKYRKHFPMIWAAGVWN